MVDPVGRRGAHDGADVVGRLHAVEQQGQAAGRAAVPLPVQPLEVGRAELPHGRRHPQDAVAPLRPDPGHPPSPRRRARRPASRRPDAGAPPARPPPRAAGAATIRSAVRGGRPCRPGPAGWTRSRRSGPAGTASGRTGRTPGRPRAAALRAVSSSARSLTSTAHTVARRDAAGQGAGDRSVAASEVEQVARPGAARGRPAAAPRCRGRPRRPENTPRSTVSAARKSGSDSSTWPGRDGTAGVGVEVVARGHRTLHATGTMKQWLPTRSGCSAIRC